VDRLCRRRAVWCSMPSDRRGAVAIRPEQRTSGLVQPKIARAFKLRHPPNVLYHSSRFNAIRFSISTEPEKHDWKFGRKAELMIQKSARDIVYLCLSCEQLQCSQGTGQYAASNAVLRETDNKRHFMHHHHQDSAIQTFIWSVHPGTELATFRPVK
jgi:hypothetical protein